jgi:hypothetical protein
MAIDTFHRQQTGASQSGTHDAGRKLSPSLVMLARILESDPTRIRRHELDQALGGTLDALGRDAVNPDVSETAFEGRRDAARNADDALRQRKNKQALQALQRCWLT